MFIFFFLISKLFQDSTLKYNPCYKKNVVDFKWNKTTKTLLFLDKNRLSTLWDKKVSLKEANNSLSFLGINKKIKFEPNIEINNILQA